MVEYKFLLFGDNIWEAKAVIELIRKYCGEYFDEIKLVGCPSLPIYYLKYKDNSIKIECRGNYHNWKDLPEIVKRYVSLFDKPDAVLYSVNNNKIICAAEFTETVSVGNSQWQRSGRAVASALLDIPFLAVYPCVAEDRSLGKLREPTSLLTEFFLKLSRDNRGSPTLLILKDDPYLSSLNVKRIAEGLEPIKRPDWEKLTSSWFAHRLLAEIEENHEGLIPLESEIYDFMFKTLKENVRKRNKRTIRINNDLPFWINKLNNPSSFSELKEHTLCDLCLVEWVAPKGKIVNNSYFKRKFINEILRSQGPIFRTYVNGGKHCIVPAKYNDYIENFILKSYPLVKKPNSSVKILDSRLPTAFIALQGWQRDGKMLSDPNTGEAVAFPTLFNSLEKKKTNIVFFIYGKPHKNWLQLYENPGKTNTLFKAIKKLGDLLCIDINNGGDNKPLSIKIK